MKNQAATHRQRVKTPKKARSSVRTWKTYPKLKHNDVMLYEQKKIYKDEVFLKRTRSSQSSKLNEIPRVNVTQCQYVSSKRQSINLSYAFFILRRLSISKEFPMNSKEEKYKFETIALLQITKLLPLVFD